MAETAKIIEGSKIMPHSKCKPHEYQDNTYGTNMRVANGMRGGFRCTVCGERIAP